MGLVPSHSGGREYLPGSKGLWGPVLSTLAALARTGYPQGKPYSQGLGFTASWVCR